MRGHYSIYQLTTNTELLEKIGVKKSNHVGRYVAFTVHNLHRSLNHLNYVITFLLTHTKDTHKYSKDIITELPAQKTPVHQT